MPGAISPGRLLGYDCGMDETKRVVTLHSRVTVELVDQAGLAEPAEFTLVEAKQADLRSGLLDVATPLGQALLGHAAGETVPYAQGDLCAVRILGVESGAAGVSAEGAHKRRRAVRKAAAQSEITNQMIFATASGSKWGDYDVNVEKLMEDAEEEEE
jgi:hypothetical protein